MARKLQTNFYKKSVKGLKRQTRNWWKGVKTLTGLNENPKLEGMTNSITNGNVKDLANHINIFLKSMSDDLKPLSDCSEISDNVDLESIQTNHWIDFKDNVFSNIKVHIAHVPDGLPNGPLRDFAPVLCKPVCNLQHIDTGGISSDTMEDEIVTVMLKVNPSISI